jgi:putative photosynthetic complex assembly protein
MSQATAPFHIRWPFWAIAGALVALIAAVAMVRLSGEPIREPESQAVVVRDLLFMDRPDGSVAVIDAKTGRQVDAIVGEAGFARGTLRGFARDRRARGIGQDVPMQLIGREDGRLTLFDPATGRVVDLESFGAINAAVFARMLKAS